LLGEGRGTSLVFVAMKDKSGPYLTVNADAPLQQAVRQGRAGRQVPALPLTAA
jgi:hypothetical protein